MLPYCSNSFVYCARAPANSRFAADITQERAVSPTISRHLTIVLLKFGLETLGCRLLGTATWCWFLLF